jgi:hypothetical protein
VVDHQIIQKRLYEIQNELASSKQGWTTKQVEDLIVRKSGGNQILLLYSHMSPFTQVGIQTEGTKTGTCKHSNRRRERTF